MGEGEGGINCGSSTEIYTFSSVQCSCSVVSDSLPPHEPQHSKSIISSQSLPKLMSIESVMPSNHLILCRPLLLHSIFPSIKVFSNESALSIRWPEYWSLSFNISPSKEHSELISFRMDWLDLLAVQGTLKRLVPNRKRSMSRLYIVTLLIQLLCRVHHEKCWAGGSTSWNQDYQ